MDNDKIEMPKSSEKEAMKVYNNIRKTQSDWEYGGTSMNNHIWEKYLIPITNRANSNISKQKYDTALGQLYGLMIFMKFDDFYWLHDQEIYCFKDMYVGFFDTFENTCKNLYNLSNEALGINETFRLKLKNLMQRIQKGINSFFEEYEDEIRLDMINMEGYVEDDNEEEEEEDDEKEEESIESVGTSEDKTNNSKKKAKKKRED